MLAPAIALAVTVAVAGCGVGGQKSASVIPSDDLPSVLTASSRAASSQDSTGPSSSLPSSPSASVTTATTPPTVAPTAIVHGPTSVVYLVSKGALVAEHRPRTQTDTLGGLINSLLAGPTQAELSRGIVTAINSNPKLNSVSVDPTDLIATIDLGASFGEIKAHDEILATAQVVMTAVSFPGVSAVRIDLDGQPASVPLADGTLATNPLRWSDYASLLAGASPAPTP